MLDNIYRFNGQYICHSTLHYLTCLSLFPPDLLFLLTEPIYFYKDGKG